MTAVILCHFTLLKIFKGTPDNFPYGNNVNPRSTDKPYTSLDNEAEPEFLSLLGQSCLG